MFSVFIDFTNGNSYKVAEYATSKVATAEATALQYASGNTLAVSVWDKGEQVWPCAFNAQSRQALHAKMDYAVSINNATTGYDAIVGLFAYMDTHGCLDAPDYIATGCTESHDAVIGLIPIADTCRRPR